GPTSRRLWATTVAALALVGVVIGGLALARPVSRFGTASGRLGAIMALVAGLIAVVNGGVGFAGANGGPGAGNGGVGGARAGGVGRGRGCGGGSPCHSVGSPWPALAAPDDSSAMSTRSSAHVAEGQLLRAEDAANGRDLRTVGLDVDDEGDRSAAPADDRGPAV